MPETWWVNPRGYVEGRIVIDGKRVRLKRHRYVAEQMLGRPLSSDEDVHHINGIKTDNRPENLCVMSHGEHTTITNERRWAAIRLAETGERS